MNHPTFDNCNYALKTYNRLAYLRNLKEMNTVVAQRYFEAFSEDDRAAMLVMATAQLRKGEDAVKRYVMSYPEPKAA